MVKENLLELQESQLPAYEHESQPSIQSKVHTPVAEGSDFT